MVFICVLLSGALASNAALGYFIDPQIMTYSKGERIIQAVGAAGFLLMALRLMFSV